MPAPSIEALRDFETQWSDALAALLDVFTAAPYTLQVASHDTTDVLITPRLEFEFMTSEPPGPDGTILMDPVRKAQIGFRGTIAFRHVYDHAKTARATAGAFRGALRTLLSPETGAITSDVLPWLKVDALNEINSARGRFKDEKEKLLSEWVSTWDVIFTIRDDAWPV